MWSWNMNDVLPRCRKKANSKTAVFTDHTEREMLSAHGQQWGILAVQTVFFLLNNKNNNFWSYFAPLINDSFSFWAFWQPRLKLNGTDNTAFKFYIKHTDNETKKQEGDFTRTISAMTELGV